MREFVMGARLNLDTSRYSSGIVEALRITDRFMQATREAETSVNRYQNDMSQVVTAINNMARETQEAAQNTARLENNAQQAATAERRLASTVQTTNNQLDNQGTQVSSLRDKVFNLQNAFLALSGSMAIKGAYNWLIGANADMEQYQNTLTVVLGSQQKAVEQMAWAEKFAAKTPFEIPSIIEATTRLESYGIESRKVLGITGDMASVMGKDLMQAVEAVADAQTGELERLKEFGITKKMIEDQAKAMGKAVTNNKGQITDQEQFNKTLFAIMQKRFKGGMDMQSKSFKGMLSNAQDFVGSMGRRLGQPLFDKAKANLQGFLGFLNGLNDSGAVDGFISKMHSGFSLVGDVIRTVTAPFKALYTMMTTGDQSYFVNLFGSVAAASGFNNFIWEVIYTLQDLWAFASGTLFPILKEGFFTAVDAVKQFAAFLMESYFTVIKYKPYIEGLVVAFAAYFAIVKAVAAATKVWGMVQAAFNAIMAINPIILVVIAIGLLLGYLVKMSGGWDMVRQKLAVLWQYMIQAWNSIKATVVPIVVGMVQTVITWFKNIWLTVQPLLVTIWTGIVNMFNAIKGFWNQWGGLIMGIFSVYWAVISSLFTTYLSIIWTLVKGAFAYIKEIISGTFKVVSGVIQVAWAVISGIFSVALNLLSGNWKGAWDSMLGMLKGVWSGIKDFFSGLKDLFFDSGVAIMKTLADGIKKMASAPFKAVGSALKKVRELLPFSDAKTGPLSSLTHNGGKIVSTMAEGVYKQSGTLHKAMNDTLADTPTSVRANGYRINPAGTSKVPAGSGGGSTVKNLIEKLVINGVDKDGKAIAEEVIETIYEALSQADDILSAGDWGALLND